jgi:hypothetical protein
MIKDFRKKVILVERLVLNTLNFDIYVTHPNIFGKLKELKSKPSSACPVIPFLIVPLL